FHSVLRFLREEEPEIVFNAVAQVQEDLVATHKALMETDQPIRAETFEGMRNRMKKCGELLKQAKGLVTQDMMESVIHDRDVAFQQAEATSAPHLKEETIQALQAYTEHLITMQQALTGMEA